MNTEYGKFFVLHKRLTGKKDIAIIRPEKFPEFLTNLSADENVSALKRAFFIVMACGGLRVSEAHSLRKSDFFWDEVGGEKILFFKVDVLKRRKDDNRYCRIHPVVQDFVWNSIKDVVGTKLFDWSRQASLDMISRIFHDIEGVCNHTFRHSAISYLLFEENLSREKVSKLIHITSKVIDNYAHLDERRALSEIFSKKTNIK